MATFDVGLPLESGHRKRHRLTSPFDPKETIGPQAFDVRFHCKKRTFGHGRLRERILPAPTGALMGWIFAEIPKSNVTDPPNFGLTVLRKNNFLNTPLGGNSLQYPKYPASFVARGWFPMRGTWSNSAVDARHAGIAYGATHLPNSVYANAVIRSGILDRCDVTQPSDRWPANHRSETCRRYLVRSAR